MDPVVGGAAKPVDTTVARGRDVEAPEARPVDALTETPATGVYRGGDTEPATRGAWPELPDPGPGPGFGEATVDRLGGELAKLEKQIDALGTGTEDMAKVMKLQRKFDTMMRIMTLISEIWKSQNQAMQTAIRNIG